MILLILLLLFWTWEIFSALLTWYWYCGFNPGFICIWLIFIIFWFWEFCILLLFNIILLFVTIDIPNPFFPGGLPKSPEVSSSSSSSPNISRLKKLERLIFPPIFGFPIGVTIVFVLFKLLELLEFSILLFIFGCKDDCLSNPPSPPTLASSSTFIDSITGFTNSFSFSLFSSIASNIFWLLIGLPICCCTILWNASGLLLRLLLLLFKLFIFSSSGPCSSLGISIPCSFFISFTTLSSSSLSSSRTNPI